MEQEYSLEVLYRALRFYEQSPDGQYDEVAVYCIMRQIAAQLSTAQ